ncbi:hypothetical protein GYMLUDRAFT_251902 [Collybiopsis luxurians FD-317 M1]|uniref:BTB domain-containing protein n=1 Tax=Collybiopsis luxurians FD-317 M1 TaxID=944289 RepID=A0A0D0AN01_9AGAR|nr:hypothetical protein GYMLUDRAFT_251902 [Collybiopsis luxurians FD-317 M1]
MFDISSILDPIQSHIALFFNLLHRGSRTAKRRANNPQVNDRSDDSARTSGAKSHTRRSRLHRRSRARGGLSSAHELSGSQSDWTNSGAVRDREYYYDSPSNDESCCILKVENTLFKVHKLVLCRDGSAFEKKLWFQHSGTSLGSSDARPLVLRASTEKFRDLLWVLHALPPDFYLNPEDHFDESFTDSIIDFHLLSLDRLLNIAEMAHKFSFPSFETWAIHQICRFIKCSKPGKSGTYSTSSSATLISTSGGTKPDIDLEEPLESLDEGDGIYARLLLIALTCDHSSLLHYLVQKLVTKVLWYNHVPGVSLVRMLERHRHHPALATLLGVVYYRILIDMPQVGETDAGGHTIHSIESQPMFHPTINVERRMQFLAAHHKLIQTWKDICSSPPPLQSFTSSKHGSSRRTLRPHHSCNDAWRCLWRTACLQAQDRTLVKDRVRSISEDPNMVNAFHGGSSADVLGLLKKAMLQLRKLTAGTSSICLDCSLEGLEALDLLRDQLIEGLIHMFVYEQ